MADMGTKEAGELWGVSQKRVADWCRRTNDPRITQDKKGSPWGLPLDALFHYYFVLYTFKGFRDEERMLKTVILLEL